MRIEPELARVGDLVVGIDSDRELWYGRVTELLLGTGFEFDGWTDASTAKIKHIPRHVIFHARTYRWPTLIITRSPITVRF